MKSSGTAKQHRAAAIAQSVERILGKDEVASSNLASSSTETSKYFSRFFLALFSVIQW